MREKFSSYAIRVLIEAQAQARALGHGYIGTEHLLLGLLSAGPCAATGVLGALKVSPEALRAQLLALLEAKAPTALNYLPFTPAAERALVLSLHGALDLDAELVGTEHLLLGIAREGSGPAGRALTALGIERDAVEREVAALSETRYCVASPGPLRGSTAETDPE